MKRSPKLFFSRRCSLKRSALDLARCAFRLHGSQLTGLAGFVALLLLLASCAKQCPVGLVVAGKTRKITLPSGGAAYVTNINLGAIDNETTYNKVSEKVADLTQLMSVCCERKIAAQRSHDQAGVTYWSNAERKCFDQFMELQKAVASQKKSENEKPAAAAPTTTGTPAAGAVGRLGQPTVTSASPNENESSTGTASSRAGVASTASVNAWLRHAAAVERTIKH